MTNNVSNYEKAVIRMNVDEMATLLLGRMERMPKTVPQRAMGDYARGEVFLLRFLADSGGIARPCEMQRASGASTARIAAAVNSMARKGWVYRQQDRDDHRKTLVHITQSGEAYAAACRTHILEILKRLLAVLGERDAREYLRILGRIEAVSASMLAEAPPAQHGKESMQ